MDNLARVHGVICGVWLNATSNSAYKYAENCIVRDAELISELARHACKWGKCDYVLHVILFCARNTKYSELLSRMSNENIAFLKEAISAAKKYKCPDKEAAEQLNLEYMKKSEGKNISAHGKYTNNIVRYSALIASFVASNWDMAIAELNKWSDVLDGKEYVAPTQDINPKKSLTTIETKGTTVTAKVNNDELWTTAELAQKLGIKVTTLYCKKSEFLKKHPEYKKQFDEWFGMDSDERKRPLFKAQYFEDLKNLFDKQSEQQPITEVVPAPNGNLWSMEKLAKELGILIRTLYCKKSEYLKNNPGAKELFAKWFVVSKDGKKHLMFKSEYFEDFKKLMKYNTNMKNLKGVADENANLWNIDQLAHELGLKNATSFFWKRGDFLKRHPEARQQFDNLIIVVNQGKKHFMFDPENLEDLKALFKQYSRKPNKKDNKQSKNKTGVATNKKHKEPIAEQPMSENSVAGAQIIDNQMPDMNQPTDMVEIKGLDAYLEQLQVLLNQAQSEQKQAEAEYADFQQKAQTAKEKVDAAIKRSEELQENIKKADGLLKELDKAEGDLRIAQQNVKATKDQINQFLFDQQNIFNK